MKLLKQITVAAAMAMGLSAFSGSAFSAGDKILIGEINSYKALPANLEPYKKGWLLAQEQVNAKGGVLGKQLETIFRDDNANAGDAVRIAEELISREQVDILTGVTLSHVGLAVTDFAKQRKRFFLASGPLSDKVVWDNGNRYTYRLRAGTHALSASVAPAAAALNKKRWALIYPNYEYGQAAVASFKSELKRLQPDVEFVAEQAPPFGRLDAGPAVQALEDAKPDAIFNVLFGPDLTKFAREGKTRGLFEGREVVSLLTGEPEYLDPLRGDAPEGWIVTGYPYKTIDTAEHRAFIDAYQKKYDDYPRLNSIIGYATVMALAAGIEKAGSTDTEALIKAFKGLEFNTPFGPTYFRELDNQSMMGIYVGRLAVENRKGVMPTGEYIPGEKLQPSDDYVKSLRKAD
ncbi:MULTISPECIES: ABC transporter substrate-binding protein [unclassified Pusillimonas]|uniref:ABC transporter substrate-binding protein n=1 Tax=unclassified Pusillimonas TaxID=2640016 RepID=UPI000B9D49D1|nr:MULTISPECIES: ABC transporter substrate-binding protein [unclassified Pusillimonas]OXR49942.1 ABC transporter substrate-binding protein [Pusillimonas sp. T2]ROT46677.1 ABC transporter substrate-binding protein [Pusillimonas sp. NJUB218]